jgi:membrane-bound lytic murein transglycosylase D
MTMIPRLLVVCLAGVIVGCGRNSSIPVAAVPAPPLPVTSVALPPGQLVPLAIDPVSAIVVAAQADFDAGQRELAAGRMVAAREHFDRAVDRLMSAPSGARSGPATAMAFDRLLDQISALEVSALRDGDGLSTVEMRTEVAAIDELLGVAMFERPKPALTTAETVRADLERTSHDIPIPANERVLSFVELFQGRLYDFMAGGLERGQRYLPMIRRVFREENVPLDLAYVPLVESAFKSNALSRARARGMWQFMPGTGAEHGLRQDWFIDERSDPEKATRAAAQYLKTLHRMFDGDWALALASYNAGPGRVQRAADRARTDDYWQLTASTRYLPRETREYVPMIMAAIVIAKNPELYGFEVDAAAPLSFERVTVDQAIDLKYIAEWSGVSVDALRELNPELRRSTTPMSSHELKVPVGTAPTIARHLASAEALFVKFPLHTVKRGETVTTIARRYRVSVAELRAANDLTSRSKLRVSQTLMIPQRPAAGLPTAVARATQTTPPRLAAPVTHRVQRGDTLYSIARRYDTTVASLKQANRLRSNTINVGDRLTIR